MDERSLTKTRKKHSAWIRYLNTKDGRDYQEYVRQRNAAQHAIRRARRRFERSLAKECKTNAKAVWGYINSRKSRSGISQLLKSDGTPTKADEEIAEVLGEQYYKTFTKEDISNLPSFPDKMLSTPPLTIIKITEEKVKKLLQNLKTDKSPGLDGLHPRILKELAEVLAKPLAMIFQRSLDSEELPRQWKDAMISPIFKTGDRKLAQNYRPVSLTSIVCKTMEKIVPMCRATWLRQGQKYSHQPAGGPKCVDRVPNAQHPHRHPLPRLCQSI
jgi:hypothetical protein